MKKYSKLFALLLVLIMVISSSACTPAAEEPPVDPGNNVDSDDLEEATDPPSVALLLNGPISDMGWNASAYNALMEIENKYGAQVSYAENVSQSDMVDMYVSYAEQGFDIIYGHGSQFTDAVLSIHQDYPDVQFVIINGAEPREPNVTCTQIADDQQGFLMGAFAALMTETGTVAMMGGLEVPPITNARRGFEAGAKYVNPDVTVLTTMTGSFDDAAAAKETSLAFIDQGADYVGAVAAAAGLGSIEACKERGVFAIGGAGGDQYEAAPDTVVVSVIKDISVPFLFAYEKFKSGELEQIIYRVGVKENAVRYSPFHSHENSIPEGVIQELEDILKKLGNEEVIVQDIAY